jgi:hypothetical protein
MQVEQLDLERKPDAPDWAQIKIDFEAGDVSVREVARRHGISDTAIHKRAKAENWKGLRQPQTESANHDAPPLQTDLQTKSVTPEDYARHTRAWRPPSRKTISIGAPTTAC